MKYDDIDYEEIDEEIEEENCFEDDGYDDTEDQERRISEYYDSITDWTFIKKEDTKDGYNNIYVSPSELRIRIDSYRNNGSLYCSSCGAHYRHEKGQVINEAEELLKEAGLL